MCLAAISFLLPKNAFAQVVYQEYATIDSIKVEYRWQRERFFAADSHAILNLQLTNVSETPAQVSFVAAFYRDGIIFFETEEQSICLLPGQTKRGNRAGLRFMAEGITMSKVEAEGFSWDIPFMEVIGVQHCE